MLLKFVRDLIEPLVSAQARLVGFGEVVMFDAAANPCRAEGRELARSLPTPAFRSKLIRARERAPTSHRELHVGDRIGWLRAAVLGVNDGIVSTASLIIGVAAASARTTDIVIAGTAGLVAGAMSMAAGEYVSVSAQADTEQAEIARERRELADDPDGELAELVQIYVERGVEEETALDVARQLMARDALAAHTRDELELAIGTRARPVQAAFASAASFTVGAAAPLIAVLLTPASLLMPAVAASSLGFLAILRHSVHAPAMQSSGELCSALRSGELLPWVRPRLSVA